MRSLVDALRGAVKGATSGPVGVVPAGSSERILPLMHDTCGCHKPTGCCGREGWHFRPFEKQDIEREIDRALALMPQGSSDNDRALVERSARQLCSHYEGLFLAYEPCEAYRSAVRESTASRPRSRNDLLGSDL